jgi:hypothetical protein
MGDFWIWGPFRLSPITGKASIVFKTASQFVFSCSNPPFCLRECNTMGAGVDRQLAQN